MSGSDEIGEQDDSAKGQEFTSAGAHTARQGAGKPTTAPGRMDGDRDQATAGSDTSGRGGGAGGGGEPPSPPGTPMFGLSSEDGQPHAQWLAEQLAGYSEWYFGNGVLYRSFGAALQTCGTLTGLLATILAAAPHEIQDGRSFLGMDWHWAIAVLTAVTTVLTGALGPVLKFARDRENGRIEMVRLRQELDILKGRPTLETFNAARFVVGRIAEIERSYGGSKAGGS